MKKVYKKVYILKVWHNGDSYAEQQRELAMIIGNGGELVASNYCGEGCVVYIFIN